MTRRETAKKISSVSAGTAPAEPQIPIERVQLGVRIEKRLAKVLNGVAQYYDMTVGETLEEILLHAFEGAQAFHPKSLKKIKELMAVYEVDYGVHGSSRFREQGGRILP